VPFSRILCRKLVHAYIQNYQGRIFHYREPKLIGKAAKNGQRNGRKARPVLNQLICLRKRKRLEMKIGWRTILKRKCLWIESILRMPSKNTILRDCRRIAAALESLGTWSSS